MFVWHLLTGEYPPPVGGVADHAWVVACGLAEAGDEVHVWAPVGEKREFTAHSHVRVHRLPDCFGAKSLVQLSGSLGVHDQILVEYVPHAFGFKSMNLGFCLWLFARRRSPITVLFHEVAYTLTARHPMKYNLMGIVHRVMASVVARSAKRIFVTIPAWTEMLRPLVGERRSAEIAVLTTHNLIPVVRDGGTKVRLRQRYAPNGLLIGTFGTYGSSLTPMLAHSVPCLLREYPGSAALLLGRGGELFREKLCDEYRDLRGRVFAPGLLMYDELSRHLSACDLLLQPYPDGATGRRSTLMAGLAHGLPIVTTIGELSEPFWAASDAVRAAPASDLSGFVAVAKSLIADSGLRERLGTNAARCYAERFDVERTITALRSMPASESSAPLRDDGLRG